MELKVDLHPDLQLICSEDLASLPEEQLQVSPCSAIIYSYMLARDIYCDQVHVPAIVLKSDEVTQTESPSMAGPCLVIDL